MDHRVLVGSCRSIFSGFFPLAIVLYVLQLIASDYPFGIFKLFLVITSVLNLDNSILNILSEVLDLFVVPIFFCMRQFRPVNLCPVVVAILDFRSA